MSSQYRIKSTVLVIFSVLFFIFSILGFLGAFGSSFGKSIFDLFYKLLGNFAWAGPIIGLIISLILWINAGSNSVKKTESRNINIHTEKSKSIKKNKSSQSNYQGSGINLPPTKLVPIKGFDKYFSNPEWSEVETAATTQELEELGKDFKTYFNEGHELPMQFTSKKYGSLKGLEEYFKQQDTFFKEKSPDEDYFNIEGATSNQIDDKKERVRDSENFYTYSLTVKKTETNSENSGNTFENLLLSEVLKEESLDEAELFNVSNEDKEEYSNDSPADEEELRGITPEERAVLLGNRPNSCIEESTIPNCNALASKADPINTNINPLESIKIETLIHNFKDQESKNTSILNSPKPKVNWILPEFNLLDSIPKIPLVFETETQQQLEKVLLDFGIQAKVIRVARGPVITRYELAPAPGVKISRIVNLADDIALALAARDVRIEAPIPGKAAIGIEVPNKNPRSVPFREVLETIEFKQLQSILKVALGKDISNYPVIADLSKMPHLLVAGATGSGKSVCITSIINSILFNSTPEEVKFLMIDPKMVELSLYNGIPHLLAPVVTDPKKAATALKWVVKEMETRYELFAAAGVRDLIRYNNLQASQEITSVNPLPLIVVIIDELADLMIVAADDVEEAICRLAQMARAAGIHLVIATQRPSVDVITGVIKANIPSRISFAVTSQIDSRTILDCTGAEKLLGRGDMLYSPQGLNKPIRVQGCLITDDEVNNVIAYWKSQGKPEYLDPEGMFNATGSNRLESSSPDDDMFIDAAELVISTGMASVSFLQRRLKLGYSRAARLMDMLEEQGLVGPYEGSKPRQVLVSIEEFQDRYKN